jgi:hypothetical protein
MKVQEVNRLKKIIETLERVSKLLEESKLAQAKKSLDTLHKKLSETSEKKSVKAPKKKATGYALFVQQHFAQVSKENPGKSAPEVMKLISVLYKKQKPVDAPKKAPARGRKPASRAASPARKSRPASRAASPSRK